MKFFKIELVFIIQATVALCLNTSPVTEKALQIASSTYHLNFATSVVWWQNDLEEVASFVSNFHGTVVLTPMQNDSTEMIRKFNKRVGYNQTVFFATGVEEFANFMSVLKPDTVISIQLILVLINHATDAEISAANKAALYNDLADIIIVSSKDTKNVDVSTYLPHRNGICGNHVPVETNSKDWFPRKFANFQGCPIRVSLLSLLPYNKVTIETGTVKSISGLDGYVFSLLIEKLNATMNIVSCKDDGSMGTFINGTATGSFADLVYRRADIFVPGMIINYLRYPVAQISHIFETIDVYWFGPQHRQESYECLRVLQPLMNDITPVIFTSFVLFIIVTKIVIRFGFHEVEFKHSVSFQSFIIFLGQGVRFESKCWLVNCLFVMWIWFCMVVRIAYQGDLIDGFQKPVLEKPFKNLEEAVKAVDGYGGSEVFGEFYRGTKYFQKFNILNVGEVAKELRKISNGKKFLIAVDRLLAYEISYDLQMMNEPIAHAPVCFFMRPGWPAAKEIDHVIQQLAEAGFVQKALKDHLYELLKKVQHASRETHPLNMRTLSGCLHGLWVMYVICALFLIMEIIYHKLTNKSKSLRHLKTSTSYFRRLTRMKEH